MLFVITCSVSIDAYTHPWTLRRLFIYLQVLDGSVVGQSSLSNKNVQRHSQGVR